MVKVPTNLVLGKNYLPDWKLVTFLYILSLVCVEDEREKKLFWGGKEGVFYGKDTNSIGSGPHPYELI